MHKNSTLLEQARIQRAEKELAAIRAILKGVKYRQLAQSRIYLNETTSPSALPIPNRT